MDGMSISYTGKKYQMAEYLFSGYLKEILKRSIDFHYSRDAKYKKITNYHDKP